MWLSKDFCQKLMPILLHLHKPIGMPETNKPPYYMDSFTLLHEHTTDISDTYNKCTTDT